MQAFCVNAMGTAEQLKDVARALDASKLAGLSMPLLNSWPPVSLPTLLHISAFFWISLRASSNQRIQADYFSFPLLSWRYLQKCQAVKRELLLLYRSRSSISFRRQSSEFFLTSLQTTYHRVAAV